jgi:hypothetical protein
LKQFLKNRIVTGFDLLHIFMRTKLLFTLLQYGDCDIRAMVGYSFIAVKCISKNANPPSNVNMEKIPIGASKYRVLQNGR